MYNVYIFFLAEEYDRHMAGKKHNEKLQAYLEKKRVAECSIFVKGFPPRTEENELVLYFQNFGPINKIVMETHEKKKVHVFVMFVSIINLCFTPMKIAAVSTRKNTFSQ